MIRGLYLNEIREDLVTSLKLLINHTENPHTDAHRDFYPEKIEPLKRAIQRLEESSSLSLAVLEDVSSSLGFERIFPLLEMAEKLRELEGTVIEKQKKTVNSYESWGLDGETLRAIFNCHKQTLLSSVVEGIFRKGIVVSDDRAYPSIMYHQGGRTIYDYIYAVTKGWLHEDIIKIWFKNQLGEVEGLTIKSIRQTAHDADRIFKYKQKNQVISGEPDFFVEIEINCREISFYLEVQHVTNNSRTKTKNLIKVPVHRVKESKKHGNRYLLIVPYVDKDEEVSLVSIVPAPLKEIGQRIEAHFVDPNDSISEIKNFLFNLTRQQ